jgi:hypothetical protein
VAEVNAWTEESIRGWQAAEIFAAFFQQHPELRYLAPSCTSEVVIGEEGTPIRLDVAVPSDLLARLRFGPRRKEWGLKHIVDGKLQHSDHLQGIHRLSEQPAAELAALLSSANGSSAHP